MSSIDLRRARLPMGAASLVAALGLCHAATASAAEACRATSPATRATVVELYTSEGCNSCPPADRWMSTWKADPQVTALAFHVDYWDRLGWKDRFASPVFTARQAGQLAGNGARFAYTPQVVIDGRDRPDWSRVVGSSDAARSPAPVDVTLTRDGDRFVATVAPVAATPTRLAAFWAVTENGHVTAVKAGENDGATLRHDFVVREYEAVGAWASKAGDARTLRWQPKGSADAAHPRSVHLVVVDAANGRPVQAVKVGC